MRYNGNGDEGMTISYLLIKGISELSKDDLQTLFHLLSDMIPNQTMQVEQDFLSIILKEQYDYDYKELITNTNAELYLNLKLYESGFFVDLEALKKDIDIKKMTLSFDDVYTNDKLLLYAQITANIDLHHKKHILKSFYDDEEFLYSIKVFIEKNQNTSEASKYLYLHRNTLINRIDKFYRQTGYDLRKFEDAAIIYLLIKDIK